MHARIRRGKILSKKGVKGTNEKTHFYYSSAHPGIQPVFSKLRGENAYSYHNLADADADIHLHADANCHLYSH
jgi:hypothetical protein